MLSDGTNSVAIANIAKTSDIPAAVSGTNDGTNWTSLTIGSDTYGLAGGGGQQTWREIDVNGSEMIAATASSPLNLVAGSYITLAASGSSVTMSMSATQESWTFTLNDGTTVNKTIFIG